MNTARSRIGVVVAVCAFAACSSGGAHRATTPTTPAATAPVVTATTTPTPPPAATQAAVRAYFATADAKKLLAFERATASLSTGAAVSRAGCTHFVDDVLPRIALPAALVTIATTAPDSVLVHELRFDVSGKFFVLATCRQGRPVPILAMTKIRDNVTALRARLALSGITY